MNAHEPLTDTELEAMLTRLTARGRTDGLEAAIMAAVDSTPQQRGRWVSWPAWRLKPAPELRLLWLLAVIGLLLALVAGTFVVASRLLERTPPLPKQLPALLEGMVTEEVEPGVLRVVNDGVRDLSQPAGAYSGFTVDVAPDGSVWLSSIDGRQELFRLGDEPVFEFPSPLSRWPPYLEVAPDGSLWGIGAVPGNREGIFSFDAEGWTMRAIANDFAAALAIGSDGTAWVVGNNASLDCPDVQGDCSHTVLMRLEDDGSLTAVEDWADVYAGDVSAYEVAVSPDGDVWLIGAGRDDPAVEAALLRFDGEGWEAIAGPAGWEPRPDSRHLTFGLDGALWVNTTTEGRDRNVGGLARFDDPGWTVFTEADGVEPWGGESWGCIGTTPDLFAVAPDGSFWLNGRPTVDGCGGVAHWDGRAWTSYLVDSYVFDLAVAPDGSVWLRAQGSPRYQAIDVQTYVIRPEVAATTE
jgi:hypothetical protein